MKRMGKKIFDFDITIDTLEYIEKEFNKDKG